MNSPLNPLEHMREAIASYRRAKDKAVAWMRIKTAVEMCEMILSLQEQAKLSLDYYLNVEFNEAIKEGREELGR